MISFKIDENIPSSSKKIFLKRNITCFDVFEEQLNGQSDNLVLEKVVEEKLTLVTLDFDFGDMRQYNKDFNGVVILNPVIQSIDRINSLIKKLLENLDKIELMNSICIFSENNIRIRKIKI